MQNLLPIACVALCCCFSLSCSNSSPIANTPHTPVTPVESDPSCVDNPLYAKDEQPKFEQILWLPKKTSLCEEYPPGLAPEFPLREVLSGSEIRKFIEKRDDADSRIITRGVRVVSEPKPVFWCSDANNEVHPDSLEAIARRVVHTIHEGYKFYSSLPSALGPLRLAPLTLQLFPKEVRFARERDERWSKRIQKDKAEWGFGVNATGEKRFELVIAPQSVAAQQNRTPYSGKFVGDIPLIIYHEFAHHLFYHHLQKVLENMTEVSKDELRFKLKFVPIDLHNNTEISRVLYGLNEGFADLMAFYMAQENESLIGDIPELTLTREIKSEFLSNGVRKFIGLDEFAHEIFSAQPRDAHWLGAILAHGINRILSVGQPTTHQKAEMLLSWLNELNESFTFGRWGGISYLQDALQRLVALKSKQLPPNSTIQGLHQLAREVFPILDGYLPSLLNSSDIESYLERG